MKRLIPIGCLIVVSALVVGGIWFVATQIPDVSKQMPPNASPMVVTLTEPLSGASIPLNDSTTITAEALGSQPITSLELWIDGALMFNQSAPAGLKQLTATWTWTPPGGGEHVLMARALNAEHRVGQSNVVRVVATKDANPTLQVTYQAKTGDTLQSIAQKFKAQPQQVIDANPQVNPTGPIAAGQEVSVPVPIVDEQGPGAENSTPVQPPGNPPPPPPPPDAVQDSPPNPPDKISFWLNKNVLSAVRIPPVPAPPALAAKAEGCNVDLFISDQSSDETGFYLYRLDPGAGSFRRIATLGAHDGTLPIKYVDSASGGVFQYFAASFTAAGESPSNYVSVSSSGPGCASPQKPTVALDNATLKVSQPVDRLYCYLDVNNRPWQRIPHAPNTFVPPGKQGVFDLSAYLKSLPAATAEGKATLDLDCWGWKGESLKYLGEAKETLAAGQVLMKASQFEVTGILPNINPPSSQGLLMIPPPIPPILLRNTEDPSECASHLPIGMRVLFGGSVCEAAIKARNYAVLVWDRVYWCAPDDPNCVSTVDGYRVYREDYPTPSVAKEVAGDWQVAIFPLPPEPSPPTYYRPGSPEMMKWEALSKNCYFVRAFNNDGESPHDNEVCLPFELEWHHLVPDYYLTRFVSDDDCSWAPELFGHIDALPNQIEVGFDHNLECNPYKNAVYRGAVHFDLSSITYDTWGMVNATLTYDFVDNPVGFVALNEVAVGVPVNCGYRLSFGAEAWMGKKSGGDGYWIPYGKYKDSLPYELSGKPQTLSVDVRSAVADWVAHTASPNFGRPNYGFVFRQATEELDHEDINACLARYGNFHLDIGFRRPK